MTEKLSIPFFILDDGNEYKPELISPHSSIYAIYTPTKYYLNPNKQLVVSTKLAIDINPLLTDESLNINIKLLSSPYLAVSKNIVLFAPTVLSPSYTGEILPIVWNTSKEVKTIEPGEELCLIEFSVTKPVELYHAVYPSNQRQQKYEF